MKVMNAIEYKEYGTAEVFEFVQVEKPKPKANEVLIRVYSTTVTAADIMMREGKPIIGRLYLGLKKPKRTIIGFEFAGEVVEIGNDVKLFSKCKNSIVENGIYLPTVFGLKILFQMIMSSIFGGKKVKTSSTGLLPVKSRLIYFKNIKELLKTGEIKTVIDKRYPLSQMVEAHLYVEKGHKKGNVVITV
jgi:NADPH:quinone reductase-like Zn-dependent oxidoreductase